MIYTLTLNPALDYVMNVGALRFDNINRSQSETVYCGGKGINVSLVLKELGVESKVLGFVGGFTGKELERQLKKDGIDCDFCHLKNGNTRINVKIKAQTELDINADGPEITNDDINALFKKLDFIKSGDTLVLAGSIPKSFDSGIYEQILQKLDGKGVFTVVDATGDLLLGTLKYKPFLIKPNHHELGELFGTKADSEEKTVELAKRLKELGAQNVLVSRAEEGAILVDENNAVTTIKNAPGELINSVGCGDSMVAGFIAGYQRTGVCSYALRVGTACGNATAYSPALAKAKEIDNMLKMLNTNID